LSSAALASGVAPQTPAQPLEALARETMAVPWAQATTPMHLVDHLVAFAERFADGFMDHRVAVGQPSLTLIEK